MAKKPNWTQRDLLKLKEMLDNHIPYSQISLELNRSIKGIQFVRHNKLKYKPLCIDCSIKLNNKINRLRCKPCATKANKINKSLYAKDNVKYFSMLKSEARFGGNRLKVLERDNFKCQTCGLSHHDIILDVHHKDKHGRNKPKEKQNHNIDNLITICHSCHTKQHKEDTIMKRWEKNSRVVK